MRISDGSSDVCSSDLVTDNPLVFPDRQAEHVESMHVENQVISAGHFHGMPLALAMSYVKAAIPVLASISERRLNKLVDPATNDGLPRSEEHTSELQSLMRISYAVFCLQNKNTTHKT